MKTVPFTKMHGLGNDFVIINVHDMPVPAQELPIQKLANRHLGIGFDQLLLITPKQKVEEFFCQIFNANGSQAEQCGNGLRCLARYVREQNLCDKDEIFISTVAGNYRITIRDYDHITVDMGVPAMKEASVNLKDNGALELSILDLGNPHAIINTNAIDKNDLAVIAREVAQSEHFDRGANVGFVEVLADNNLRLRTFERGAGETNACGSNACAAAVVSITHGWVHSPVNIQYRYGELQVVWEGNNHPVQLTGPATMVFSGTFDLTLG
jgi:diaminopimelate epimerase